MTRTALKLRDLVEQRPRLTATALVLLSTVVLLARLGSPDRIIFDETYYVEDALGYLDTGVEPSFAVHPTLGKWLIAAGIAVFGDQPFGWRIAAALAGIVTVLCTHLLARRLLVGARWGPLLAVLAPLLLLTDGLFVTQSRIGMLDAFLVTGAVAAMLLLVIDRDRRRAHLTRPWRPSVRWLAGVVLGLAIAVKWSGVLVLGAAGLLAIAWEVAAVRRAEPSLRAGVSSLGRRAVAVIGSLVLIPAIVYGLTWIPWLASYEHTWASDCEDVEPRSDCADATAPVTERVDGLVRYHDAMIDFHLGLESDHSYRGDPLGWVVLRRPVVYYWETCTEDRAAGVLVEDDETGEMVPPEPCEVPVGTAGEVMAIGNPAVWWGFLLAVPLLAGGLVRRDRRSAVALVTWLALWLPWLFVSRAAFIFYMAPAVPFLALGIALAIARLDLRQRMIGAYVGGAAGLVTGLASGLAVQLIGIAEQGWRMRLIAALAGALSGTFLGAGRDLVRDLTAGGRTLPFRPAATPHPDPVDDPVAVDPPGDGSAGSETARRAGEPAVTPGGVGVLATPSTAVTVLATGTDGARTTATVPDDGGQRRATTPGALAPLSRVPTVALTVLLVATALWVFFGPIWYGVPLARDVLEWRWWFTSWV